MKRAVRVPDADLKPIRPLVVPITPEPGESLPGLVARSTLLNVLRRPRIILSEVGLSALGTGTIGTDIGGLEARLAKKIGCSADEVAARGTPFTFGSSETEVAFGDGHILRAHLNLRHRWVSPATLAVRNVHLALWTCRLLPFCPFSLERLICRCTACGRTLAWASAKGIDICEHCCEQVRHPDNETLPAHLADGYLAFARLISPDRAERNNGRSALDPQIAALPQPALINLVVGLGRNCRQVRVEHNAPVLITKPRVLADVLSLGTMLIHDFPRRLRSAVVAEIERIGWEEERPLRPLLKAIRSVANNSSRPEQRRIMREALPEVFEPTARALGGFRAPVMLLKDVVSASHLSSAQVKRLIHAKALNFSMAGSGPRPKLQFEMATTLDFVARLKRSKPASWLQMSVGVPRYAIEQMICVGELDTETHQAISILYPGLRIVDPSEFLTRLEGAARMDATPPTAIPLIRAVRGIGGRCKPWAAILQAMFHGNVTFWIGRSRTSGCRDVAFSKRAFVQPETIAAFDEAHFDESEHPSFKFLDHVSQIDTCDILNLDHNQVTGIARAGGLEFRPTARNRLDASKSQVLRLASAMIGPAEISVRTGIHPNSVPRLLAANRRIRPLYGMWRRGDVMREIPSLPGPGEPQLR